MFTVTGLHAKPAVEGSSHYRGGSCAICVLEKVTYPYCQSREHVYVGCLMASLIPRKLHKLGNII